MEEEQYKYDKDLVYDRNFGRKLEEHEYDPELVKDVAFPNDYLLATFSDLAYRDQGFDLPEGWHLLTTAYNKSIKNCYFGVAFWNKKLCHVVVAHRGTDPKNVSHLYNDFKLGVGSSETQQSKSAATFVHLVNEELERVSSSNLRQIRFRLSITGHSLGAWLAQVSTFTLKYFKKSGENFVENTDYMKGPHPHTVVFECPGCREALEKLTKRMVLKYARRDFGNYESLDMTVYQASLNPINGINEQVGIIYQVKSSTHAIKDIKKLFTDKETGEIPKEVIRDFRSGIRTFFYTIWTWGILRSDRADKTVTREAYDSKMCSLNVFDDDELKFVKFWPDVRELDSPLVQHLGKFIPEYEIDRDYNSIRSFEAQKTVARIKSLKTDSLISELLNENIKDRIIYQYKIFKSETSEYEKSLLDFHGYQFKDKYGLEDFMNSSSRILNVKMDGENSFDCGLEMSILNNVCNFYEGIRGEYGYLKMDKLNEDLRFTGGFFQKVNIRLLITECFELNQEEIEAEISKFLNEHIEVKIVLVSTHQYPSKLGGFQIESVAGCGRNVTLQDLTEDSQRKLKNEKKVNVHGREINLEEVIKSDFPFNKNVLIDFIRAPPSEPIVIDSQRSISLEAIFHFRTNRLVDFKKDLLKEDDELFYLIQNEESLPDRFETKRNVKIRKRFEFERECENLNKIIYQFSLQEDDKLVLNGIFNRNFYMKRHVYNEKIVDESIFVASKSNSEYVYNTYYFCGDESWFDSKVLRLNYDDRSRFKYIKSQRKAKRIVQSSTQAAHLMKICGGKIYWLYSNKSVNSLREYVKTDVSSVEEIKITENEEDVIIISGSPGIGKSSTLGYFYSILQNRYWVFYVPLKHSVFEEISESVTFASVVRFVLKASGIPFTHLTEHLLSHCLKNNTKLPVYLLFDAFDEIHDPDNRKTFMNMVNFLKGKSAAKILITTRSFRCSELENGIAAFASHYDILESAEQTIQFLSNFWYTQVRCFTDNGETLGGFRDRAQSIVDGASRELRETISSFIGVPLHLRMMAEIITPFETDHRLIDVPSLFQSYTEAHYDLYFKRIRLPENEIVREWLRDSISRKLHKLAIAQAFSLIQDPMEAKEIEELNDVGLVQSESDGNIYSSEFLHESVRDYLVADLLKNWLKSFVQLSHARLDIETFLTSDFLLNPEFKEIRFFLNHQLKHFSISRDRLESCQNKLKSLMRGANKNFLCKSKEESVFHVYINENLHALINYFLLRLVEKLDEGDKIKLLTHINSELKTPLLLAIEKAASNDDIGENILTSILEVLYQWPNDTDIEAVLYATLFLPDADEKIVKTLAQYSAPYIGSKKVLDSVVNHRKYVRPFLEACKSNNNEGLELLLQNFKREDFALNMLLSTTNKELETPLHLVVNEDVLKILLSYKMDVNKRDQHGMTPLCRAIKRKNTNIAVTLLEHSAKNISDNLGNSPLMHAVKLSNFEVIQLLLGDEHKNEYPVDETNSLGNTALMLAAKFSNEVIIKYLLEHNADPELIDYTGTNALYHAVKKNRDKPLVGGILKKCDNINVKDFDGITPLLHCIDKNKWNLAMHLLDNGANPYIPDETTVLYELERKNKPHIIKHIKKKFVRPDL